MSSNVRVRFAPSPTGGLHLGGVRTVLFNYLFAKQQQGTFVLRIEDTDRTRFVEGAEDYIFSCLDWCGLQPDESLRQPGAYAPYRQSERQDIYKKYALELVEKGHAYYAFDTPEDIEAMRQKYKPDAYSNAQYDSRTRQYMRNSLTLSKEEVDALLANNTPYVIRIKMPETGTITFNDLIRGEQKFESHLVDDKVLLKQDGFPTYHLAVVVDDYLMKITHAFRGEEWLPSAPVHILLWKYLGWEDAMPAWAHLPLILKPDGHGKLSKRDGQRLGFPVFAKAWTDPNTGETSEGFEDKGFLPEAFVNFLALLGWNPGTEQEIFTLDELIAQFSIERINLSGAKFDYEKAKWFNNQWIQKLTNDELIQRVKPFMNKAAGRPLDTEKLAIVVPMIKERCSLLTDFWEQGFFFFEAPKSWDLESIQPKWSADKQAYFNQLIQAFEGLEQWTDQSIEAAFNQQLAEGNLKKGDVMLPLRIMLVGGKFGPGVFHIAGVIGKDACLQRMQAVLQQLS